MGRRFLYVMGAFLVGTLASASSAAEMALMEQADAAYAQREDVPQAKIAMILYERAAFHDSKDALEAYWKASRAAWWLGQHAAVRAEKMDYFQKGTEFAQKAVALNNDSAAAHAWLGNNQGSYGDTKGIMKSLSLIKPVRHEMAEVLRIDDHFGGGEGYRVLGVVDYKVPGMMGGDKKRAKEELEKAMAIGPLDPFNHYYLADYYKTIGDKEKKTVELETLRTLKPPTDLEPELKMLQQKADQELN